MGRNKKDGSNKGTGVGRGGIKPPDNTGKKYKRHIPLEEDKRTQREWYKPTIYQDLDGEAIKKMCSIGCTQAEIASICGVSTVTLQKYIDEEFGVSWNEFYSTYADGFKMSLRRMQYKSALGEKSPDGEKYIVTPSVPMQIWLGKQYLDQKDKHETILDDKTSIPTFEWADATDVTNQKQLNDAETKEQDETDSIEGTSEDDQ